MIFKFNNINVKYLQQDSIFIHTGVNSSVLLEIHLGPESFAAELALEVPLARVDHPVDVQRKLPGKVLAAKLALVKSLKA